MNQRSTQIALDQGRSKTGELVGFEIDIANKIAGDMGGVKAEFIPTAFDGIIPGLLTGKFDIIVTGLTVVPKRALSINYSIPYQTYGGDMVLSKEIASSIKSMEELNKPDIKLATRRGSFGVRTLKRFFPKAQILQFDDDAQAFQDVINGKAHGIGALDPKSHFYVTAFPDRLFLGANVNLGYRERNINFGGLAIRKGDMDFLNYLDTWIRVQQLHGWLDERKAYWFESDDWFEQIAKNPLKVK